MLPIGEERTRSLAIAPDAKRFFLGSNVALRAFDDAATKIWSYLGRGEVWAANASKDGRLVVAAYGDGTIRWHRADDGRELRRRTSRSVLRFDVRSLTLLSPPPNDSLTIAPNCKGLTVDGWRDGASPTLAGRELPLADYTARSLASNTYSLRWQ